MNDDNLIDLDDAPEGEPTTIVLQLTRSAERRASRVRHWEMRSERRSLELTGRS